MYSIELIVNFIMHPRISVDSIQDKSTLLPAGISFVFSMISIILSTHVISGTTRSVSGLLIATVFLLIIGCGAWITLTSFIHLGAEIGGGNGRVTSLLNFTGLSTSPIILLIPISLIIVFLDFRPSIIFFICSIVILIWVFILLMLSISQLYSISIFRSFLLVMSPVYLIPLTVAGIVIAILMIVLLTGSIQLIKL